RSGESLIGNVLHSGAELNEHAFTFPSGRCDDEAARCATPNSSTPIRRSTHSSLDFFDSHAFLDFVPRRRELDNSQGHDKGQQKAGNSSKRKSSHVQNAI